MFNVDVKLIEKANKVIDELIYNIFFFGISPNLIKAKSKLLPLKGEGFQPELAKGSLGSG